MRLLNNSVHEVGHILFINLTDIILYALPLNAPIHANIILSRAHMQMFQISINKLPGWLFSRVLAEARVRFPAGTCQSWDL